jgi:hypothetical protein
MARRPARFVHWLRRPVGGWASGLLALDVGGAVTTYRAARLGGGGEVFRLEKVGGGKAYTVWLAKDEARCTCPGFARWGRCKHASGLAALRAREAKVDELGT